MQRLYFKTIKQTVECKVIVKTVNNKIKDYDYYFVKLPATFLEQTVELWHPRLNKGKYYVGKASGSSCSIRIERDDFKGLRKGDKMIASFNELTNP